MHVFLSSKVPIAYLIKFIPCKIKNIFMLYHGKVKVHSEMKLIVYQLKCYRPTSIISLALLVLCPKLVLLLTNVLSELFLCFPFYFLLSAVLEKPSIFYTSAILEVMWYKPLYNNLLSLTSFFFNSIIKHLRETV